MREIDANPSHSVAAAKTPPRPGAALFEKKKKTVSGHFPFRFAAGAPSRPRTVLCKDNI